MLQLILAQMKRKSFLNAAEELQKKWSSLNLYEKKRIYYNWHFEWPNPKLPA